MTDSTPDPPELDPANLAGSTFTRARKGFEPAEVHKVLGRAADALRAWQERDARLVEHIDDLEEQLAASAELDEQRITEVLGEETARIVKAARDAAAEIRANARAEADRLVTDAQASATATLSSATSEAEELRSVATREHDDALAESARLRAEAIEESARMRTEAEESAAVVTEAARADAERRREEAEAEADRLRDEAQQSHDDMLARAGTVLEERTSEAEAVAAGIRENAESELAAARTDGERVRAEARDAATEEIERARAEGREMVAEARRVRERMLRDLAERRRTARRQIEAARAGRDRIVEALRATSDTLEDAVEDLSRVDEEAARAADAAAAAVVDDIDHVVAELETGLRTGTFDTESVEDGSDADDLLDEVEVADEVEEADGVEEADEVDEVEVDDEVEAVEDGDGGERSPGATVHDLFERIRAERAERADDAGAEVAPIDLTATAVATLAEQAEPSDPDGADDGPVLDPVTAVLDRRDQLLGPAEKALARTLKRLVSDEQNEVLDRLRRLKRGRPELDSLLPQGPDVERFVAALEPEFGAAVGAGETFWGELGTAVECGSHEGPYPRLAELVDELLGNRRVHVQKVLDDADAEGLELAEIGDHVRAAYREWRSGPVPELAGDLATAGFAEGVRRAAGPDGSWCWIPDNGGLPCADAEDNALAGAVRCGEAFPTGDVLPPAHSGCRCILVPAHR